MGELTPDALLERLHQEFFSLNHAHFAERLKCPEIVLSKRKSYGGYYQPQRHRIVLSWQAYEEHGWDEVVNTFRHEVAHVVHPNHSKAFWELAARLGVTRRYAASPLKPLPRLYTYECPQCRRQFPRRRRLRAASCARCDTKYNPHFALRLVEQ